VVKSCICRLMWGSQIFSLMYGAYNFLVQSQLTKLSTSSLLWLEPPQNFLLWSIFIKIHLREWYMKTLKGTTNIQTTYFVPISFGICWPRGFMAIVWQLELCLFTVNFNLTDIFVYKCWIAHFKSQTKSLCPNEDVWSSYLGAKNAYILEQLPVLSVTMHRFLLKLNTYLFLKNA
jgi:hypothetical protein